VVPAERRRMIIDLLREQGSVSVAAVEERFGVSSMTARRDLALLDEKGYARRTHGGAILPELAGHEDSFQSRLAHGIEPKLRIAQVVAQTVAPHETVFVDSSSSSYYVVRELLEAGTPFTLLTNSLPVMTLVGAGDHPQVELIGVGGSFRLLNRSFVGSAAVKMIERYFADRIVFSVKGIELDGYLTDPDPFEAEVKRAMIERSRSVLLVAQGHKFDERGLNVVVPLSRVDQAYLTDVPIAGSRVLREAGVDVISV
jgi:DeoR/GlpR family transcriptional regulator of sugar metabolism